MAQFYQVVNGNSATFTIEELRAMYPNIQNLQCIDGSNASIQYIINQEDSTVQYHNQVIGIDQTGATLQLETYQQPVVLDSSLSQQGVYVIETVDPSTQVAVDLQDQQVIARHHPTPQFVVQQLPTQNHSSQSLISSQQQHTQIHQSNTQPTIVYGGRQGDGGITLLDASLQLSGSTGLVAEPDTSVQKTQVASDVPQSAGNFSSITKFPSNQVEQKAQTHLVAHVNQLQGSVFQLPNGQKITLTDWQQLQQQPIQVQQENEHQSSQQSNKQLQQQQTPPQIHLQEQQEQHHTQLQNEIKSPEQIQSQSPHLQQQQAASSPLQSHQVQQLQLQLRPQQVISTPQPSQHQQQLVQPQIQQQIDQQQLQLQQQQQQQIKQQQLQQQQQQLQLQQQQQLKQQLQRQQQQLQQQQLHQQLQQQRLQQQQQQRQQQQFQHQHHQQHQVEAKTSNDQQQMLLGLVNSQSNNGIQSNSSSLTSKQIDRPGVITIMPRNAETNSVIVPPVRTQTVQQPRKAQQRRTQQNCGQQSLLHQQQTPPQQYSQTEQNSEQIAMQVPSRQANQLTSPRRTYVNKRSRSHTLIANNTIQAIASPTGEQQNLLQQHDNVISVVDQNNQVVQQTHTKEIQQQTPRSTQVVLLLPNGEQRIISVDDSTNSIKDILGQIGINLDSNVTVSNEICVPFDKPNQVINETIKKEPDSETPLQAHPTVSVSATPTSILQKTITSPHVLTSQQIKIQQVPVIDHKPIPPELPKYVDGMLALCHNCGYTSVDFNRCQRCKKKLPSTVKSIAAVEPARRKLSTSPKEKGGKLMIKVETEAAKNAKKSRVRRSRKLVEEPVILTLSSDDEDQRHNDTDNSVDAATNNHHSVIESTHFGGMDNSVTAAAMDKEPVISRQEEQTAVTGDDQDDMEGNGLETSLEGIIDGSIQGQYTLLQCRTVRIGSYKVVPAERVILSSVGMRICVPSIEDESKMVSLTLNMDDVVKVLIHFGRGMPVLFFYAKPGAASKIRNALKMDSKNGPYYDPASHDETQKRITLLPERLSEDSKCVLKHIFGTNNRLDELNNKEANDILVRASPKEVQNMMKKAVGLSPHKPVNNEIHTILVYPPHPGKGGIPINTEDYACLGEDQFLNDVIIDFYLRYLTLSVLSPHDQKRTHVFSSFFYKRLTTRPVRSVRRLHPVEDDPKLSAAEKRHSRVKSWTKNVNLFDKDFVVIPINEHCHWFLAIICFPGLTGPVKMSDNTPVEEPVNQQRSKSKKKVTALESPPKTLQIGCTTITPVKCTDTITLETGEDGSDRDEAEGEDEDMDHSSTDEEESTSTPSEEENSSKTNFPNTTPEQSPKVAKKGKSPKPVLEPIKQPCILIFDSLAGASRTRVVATLRDYLRIECKVKGGQERDFSKDTIRGACPKVPQQTNFTDCGLYLLQYVESFFQNPITDYRLPTKQLANWFPEEVVNRKREELQKLLLSLMEKSGVDIASLNLPKLTFSSHSQEMKVKDSSGDDSETAAREGDGCPAETSTEEEPQSNYSASMPGLGQVMNDSGSSSCGPSSVYTQPSQDSVSLKSDRVSLVNYSDDSDEKNPPSVDSDTSCPSQTKKSNTLTYLKSKRIERHLNKEGEKPSPAKKVRTEFTSNEDNR